MAERVEVDVQDRSDEHAFGYTRRLRAHVTQAPVFVLERRKSLQLQVGQRRRAVSSRFSCRRLSAIGERLVDPVPGAERKIHDPLHGMHDRAEPFAHLVDLSVAVVGDHQPDRDRREHDERRD